MPIYEVSGSCKVYVYLHVDAPDEDRALDLAAEEAGELMQFVGNGSSSRLIGLDVGSIQPDEYIEYKKVLMLTDEEVQKGGIEIDAEDEQNSDDEQ